MRSTSSESSVGGKRGGQACDTSTKREDMMRDTIFDPFLFRPAPATPREGFRELRARPLRRRPTTRVSVRRRRVHGRRGFR